MRVLYLNDYADVSGGAELQLHTLRHHVEEAGAETLYLGSDVPLADEPLWAQNGRRVRGHTGHLQVLSQVANVPAYRAVREAVRDFRPDLVHIRMFLWQLSPLVLAPLKDVPVLYQTAVYKAVCPNGRKLLPGATQCRFPAGQACLREGCLTPQSWVAAMAQRRVLDRYRSRVTHTVSLSQRMADVMTEAGWLVDEVIPNGVAEKAQRPPLAGPPEVSYAGRFDREKGLYVLVDAMAILAEKGLEACLTLAGGGPEQAALEAYIQERGVSARFVGRLARPQMEKALAGAWVHATPSLWEEPFGNVSTEAMMRGTSVVASRIGGQADIVADGETGALVPPGNAEALAAALGHYLEDRTLAEAHGAAARQRALEYFSNRRVAERFLSRYRALIAAEG